MKSILRTTVLFLFALLTTLASKGQDLVYFVELNSFYDSEGKPYIEINLDINAYSVAYSKDASGMFNGVINVRYEISPKADPKKFAYDRSIELLSPPTQDTSRAGTSFGILDLRRVSLEPGEYVLTGYLKDKQRNGALQHRFTKDFIIDAQATGGMSTSNPAFISAISPTKAMQPHSKHGFDIVPLVNDGNFIDSDSLRYYLETYNSTRQTNGVYFVNAFITQANASGKMRQYSHTQRHTAKALDIVTGAFNIRNLPTGTYYLNLDFYNQAQDTIAVAARKFYVINSRSSVTTEVTDDQYHENFDLQEKDLDYYIHTLYYISTSTEQEFVKSLSTLAQKQNYFYSFWEKRKEKPTDPPSRPWNSYKARVDYANQNYKAAHTEGWRTDRGRVLLTQGPPNDIERFPSSNTLHPHEIWRYNKLLTQANVRFIFFNPNEATADYVLLHSDLRGERNNPRYEFDLTRSTLDGNLDVNKLDGTKQR